MVLRLRVTAIAYHQVISVCHQSHEVSITDPDKIRLIMSFVTRTKSEENNPSPLLVSVGGHRDDVGVADVPQVHRVHILEQLTVFLLKLVVVYHLEQ